MFANEDTSFACNIFFYIYFDQSLWLIRMIMNTLWMQLILTGGNTPLFCHNANTMLKKYRRMHNHNNTCFLSVELIFYMVGDHLSKHVSDWRPTIGDKKKETYMMIKITASIFFPCRSILLKEKKTWVEIETIHFWFPLSLLVSFSAAIKEKKHEWVQTHYIMHAPCHCGASNCVPLSTLFIGALICRLFCVHYRQQNVDKSLHEPDKKTWSWIINT